MVLGVTGGVVTAQRPAAAEIDRSGVLEGHDAIGGDGRKHAEEPVERIAVDQPGAGHQPARIGEVPRAPVVHNYLSRRIHGGDVARAARMVEVNMRDHDGREVGGADPESGQGIANHRRGRRGPRFHQARPLAPDQVAGRDPVIARHPCIDLEHLVPQRGDVRCLGRIRFVHRIIVPDRTDPRSRRAQHSAEPSTALDELSRAGRTSAAPIQSSAWARTTSTYAAPARRAPRSG